MAALDSASALENKATLINGLKLEHTALNIKFSFLITY